MSDSFGAKARRFMGWYSADDIEMENEDFIEEEDFADVTPMSSATPASVSSITPIREASSASELSRIVTFHPTSFSDSLSIGDAYRKGVPVILNLSDLNDAEARRIVDFAAGLAFGLHGVIERVTNRVFLLSPRTVEVTGEHGGPSRSSFFN